MTIRDRFAEILSGHAGVDLVVLFGSAAREALRAESDIDLAWRVKLEPRERRTLSASLERAAGRTIDFIDMDEAPPQLRFEIAREGIILVARSRDTWIDFRARAFTDWWDFAPIARLMHKRTLERLRLGPH